jgi:hypothetical protein
LSALAGGVAVHISSENKIYYTLGEGSSGQKFNLELNEEIPWKVGVRQETEAPVKEVFTPSLRKSQE